MNFRYDPKDWSIFSPGQSPEEFYREMTKDLPENTRLSLVTHKGVPKKLYFWQEENSARTFNYIREIHMDHHSVEHVSAKVTKQGEGTSRIVNRNLLPLYQRLGIERIHGNLTNIGLYAWPRLGFMPTRNSWRDIKRNIGARLDHLELNPCPETGPLSYKYLLSLREALKDDAPKALWFIVDQNVPYYGTTLGKLLTLDRSFLPPYFKKKNRLFSGINYTGTIDLKDADCTQRMHAYLGITPKKKPDAIPAPGFSFKL